MSIVQALVLGAVQGLTEFIPISSSGHLVVVPAALDWPQPGLAFDVLLHAASLVALLAYFSGDLVDLARGSLRRDPESMKLVWLLAVGTVPAVIAGLALGDYFEGTFEDAEAAAIQLAITAVILVAAEQLLAFHTRRTARIGGQLRSMHELNALDAALVGVAQAVSILPGISRSGSTIGAGLGLSMTRSDAARFAFLLAIPALAGATLVEIPEMGGASIGIGSGTVGFIISLATSYAAIWGLIRYLRTNTLYPFAAYCLVASVYFYLVV
ncbi:MAG: undecaprenyl-diphosphate phosphatase [Actinomycetota bacterium]